MWHLAQQLEVDDSTILEDWFDQSVVGQAKRILIAKVQSSDCLHNLKAGIAFDFGIDEMWSRRS
jgi:hypothetical protein